MASFTPNSNHKTSTTILLAITISASLIILFAIIYFLYFLYHFLVQRSRTSPFDSTATLNKLQNFSYKELKSATHNFNDSNCLGRGGSGSVFTGMLKDGKLVAVKILYSNSCQEFENELKILGGVKFCSCIVSLLGFCVEKEKRVLVYEYMPNKSLQESLLFESNDLTLDWAKRFNIVIDVAKALAFLHLECEPPVIHGDVKPSNVLLDSDFRAKLSDFGLSRFKLEGELGVDLYSQDLWKSQELSRNLNTGAENGKNEKDEVDFGLALQASSSKNNCKIYNNCMGSPNFTFKYGCENDDTKGDDIKGKELLVNENGYEDWNKFTGYEEEFSSLDHSKELNVNNVEAKSWGKDWWWRQDESGELCSKDYVNEWIGTQICHSSNSEWDEEKGTMPVKNHSGLEALTENQVQEPGFECFSTEIEKGVSDKKHRKMHEWWLEENLEELGKMRKGKIVKMLRIPHFGLGKRFWFTKRRKFGNEDENDHNLEFSFRKGRKKKKSRSSEIDVFSQELSSTTSMRGTLCYVAPEYGGCGYLIEKTDIYSFGVLILVILSGRRPLHVLSSPMKLEKANLISWARQLAHKGNVLDLMDVRLNDEYKKEEASLCIYLALACLQKMPELRPDIGDVLKILKGEMELPPFPFEFSPSPPSKRLSRSRRKQKTVVDQMKG